MLSARQPAGFKTRKSTWGSEGFKTKQIARMTGHDPKTVHKYIKAQAPPRYNLRSPRPSGLDPYKPYRLTRIQEKTQLCTSVNSTIELLLQLKFIIIYAIIILGNPKT